MFREITLYRKQLGMDTFGANSIKAQAKVLSKEVDGKQFVPLLVNSENIVEKFLKVFDEKVSKYANLVSQTLISLKCWTKSPKRWPKVRKRSKVRIRSSSNCCNRWLLTKSSSDRKV